MAVTQQMKKAVGCVRVSTEGQAAHGVSMEAQEAKIRAWAMVNDHTLIPIHVDKGISGGKVTNRPELQEPILEACRHNAALVVYSLSRLARSAKDALEISERLRKSRTALVSLSERIDTTSTAGKMVFRVLAVLAESEGDLISERTTMALRRLKGQHRRVNHNIPLGWELADDGKPLVENEQEQKVITLIRSLREKGMSLRAIAAELNRRRLHTKKSRQFSHITVYGILKEAA